MNLAECPLLAHSGHQLVRCPCPLSGVKRTWVIAAQISAFDPKRTWRARLPLLPEGYSSYGADTRQAYRFSAGIYTCQVLKGEKPANLPIQQSTKVELVINLKTAKVLGIDIPNTLIGRADEVIQ